jgi:hypothetical protein
MIKILRVILFFLLASAYAIVAQAVGAVQDDFRVVDAGFQAELVDLEGTDGGIFNYDSSGVLLQQRRSLNGEADEDDLIGHQKLEQSEETSRVTAAVGIVAGVVPGGKAVVKGGAKVVAKYGPIVWRYTTDFVSSSWNKLFGKTAAKTPLQIAQEGGRHAGFLKNYAGKSPAELQKGIASLEKQIAEHQVKIADPEKFIPNFKQLDPRQQKALLESKWPGDIQRQQEQADILRGLLGN